MDQVNWGMIGCGDVTEVKSAPALNKVPHSRLVMVMRRDGDKAQDYAQRHDVPKWTNDAEALINDPEVNAVYIATPPDSHARYTRLTAQAGKPVYVEKPMARTHAECVAMIEACAQGQVPLYVAYYRRCLPNHLKVKSLIEEGAIGDVRTVHIQQVRPVSPSDTQQSLPWRLQPELAGGGHFMDLAVHPLDFLDYLFGPIATAQGCTTNQAGLYPAEDSVCASFAFASGVLGTGHWCFTAAAEAACEFIEIVGSEGRIRFSTFDHDVPVELETPSRKTAFAFTPPPHIQQPLIETMVAALRGECQCPSTGESAARTNWVTDQILASYRT